jgi:DNA replicative helicase MCM subunit Mcm2 (Cdc46/Mcm family)
VEDRWNWLLANTQKYTQIIGRQNIAAAVLLCFFTPLTVTLYNETSRGWGHVDIIGDSTIGKSETAAKIARLLKNGMVISAETATIAGIIGAVVQISNGGWMYECGSYSLMDRKVLITDGCHKLPTSHWAQMAEAERTGILKIAKAAKAEVPARVRHVKIANAVDKDAIGYPTKQISDFFLSNTSLSDHSRRNNDRET